jgi:hypothetical protein
MCRSLISVYPFLRNLERRGMQNVAAMLPLYSVLALGSCARRLRRLHIAGWPRPLAEARSPAAACCRSAVGLLHGQCACPYALEDTKVSGGYVAGSGGSQVEDRLTFGRDAVDVLSDKKLVVSAID